MQEQCPQEDLVYADVTVASKHKKTTATTNRPTVSTTQPDLTVEYSAINFKLCDKKSVMDERPSHGIIMISKLRQYKKLACLLEIIIILLCTYQSHAPPPPYRA